jgi:HMG (high mobility group) box
MNLEGTVRQFRYSFLRYIRALIPEGHPALLQPPFSNGLYGPQGATGGTAPGSAGGPAADFDLGLSALNTGSILSMHDIGLQNAIVTGAPALAAGQPPTLPSNAPLGSAIPPMPGVPPDHPDQAPHLAAMAPHQQLNAQHAPPQQQAEAQQADAQQQAGGKPRKRRPHDPNAPKRALTSYFLFMADHKREIKEAHPEWTAQQISEECEKRWQNISIEEKQVRRHILETPSHAREQEAY